MSPSGTLGLVAGSRVMAELGTPVLWDGWQRMETGSGGRV